MDKQCKKLMLVVNNAPEQTQRAYSDLLGLNINWMKRWQAWSFFITRSVFFVGALITNALLIRHGKSLPMLFLGNVLFSYMFVISDSYLGPKSLRKPLFDLLVEGFFLLVTIYAAALVVRQFYLFSVAGLN